MYLTLYKSKIHRATVTETEMNYIGSITIDGDLMDAAGILPHERVQVLGLNSGARIETYVIRGERGSGVICLNGPAAHFFDVGDIAIVIAYAMMTPEEAQAWQPKVVFVDEQNKITRVANEEAPCTYG